MGGVETFEFIGYGLAVAGDTWGVELGQAKSFPKALLGKLRLVGCLRVMCMTSWRRSGGGIALCAACMMGSKFMFLDLKSRAGRGYFPSC